MMFTNLSDLSQVTVSKKEEPAAGMSMIEVGLLSGYEVVLASLDDLLVQNVVDGQGLL